MPDGTISLPWSPESEAEVHETWLSLQIECWGRSFALLTPLWCRKVVSLYMLLKKSRTVACMMTLLAPAIQQHSQYCLQYHSTADDPFSYQPVAIRKPLKKSTALMM